MPALEKLLFGIEFGAAERPPAPRRSPV